MRQSSWENCKARKNSITKARRKQEIAETVYGWSYYDNLHQYSKNKIHCSCNLCRFRPVWNPDAKPMQDIKNIAKMDYRLKEYENDAS